MDVLKPFLMLACVAFVTGFMGYLAMARLDAAAQAPAETWSSTVSAPLVVHALGDFETTVDDRRVVVDIKTKLLDRASAPKAHNVDEALEPMSRPGTVLGIVSARLLPVLESS